MAALIAVDAREPFMKVAAIEKALEDLGLYRPMDQPGLRRSITRQKIRVSTVRLPRIGTFHLSASRLLK